MASSDAQEELDRAYARLQDDLPDRFAKVFKQLRAPRRRWVRIPTGILLIALSFFWFLPMIGIEFLPLGLLLLAQDVPFLRRPVARFIVWADRKWAACRRWWRR
jgi:hypothetical protein